MRHIWTLPTRCTALSLSSLQTAVVSTLSTRARQANHSSSPLGLLRTKRGFQTNTNPSGPSLVEEIMAVSTTSRLATLRSLMRERKVDIYVVPSEDSHASEYIAECDMRRAFISGFTGSAGTAVVTLDKAALATDGRYFNQAAKQLDSNWHLLKTGLQDVPTWQEWASQQSEGGKVVGVDPSLISSSIADKLNESIVKAGGARLEAVKDNLVDLVWADERPARPTNPIFPLGQKYSGKDTTAKLGDIRKELEKKKALGFVLSMLDEIAWLFNLRGSDIAFNPVFFAYAIVTLDSATLYVDASKLTPESQSYLEENKISIKSYTDLFVDTEALAAKAAAESASGTPKKHLVSNKASWALKLALGGDKFVDEIRSPIGDAKAIKNEVELNGMRNCHIRDGAALSKFFAWLEDQLVNKKAVLDEVQAADKLEEIRSEGKDFVGLSFDTISSTGPNAAVIHYKPEIGQCALIDPNAIYLCDSGAQYYDGTTDVTRTLHFGTPTPQEKEAYTLVLKGNIALDTAVFPKGTNGFAIDCLARQYLWKRGLDYRHGTGHGVGSFLNVHEGPIGIGTRKQYIDVALAAGNVLSIEPGFYEDGAYGIRIENLAIVKEVKTQYSFGDKPYLGFEHVTMVPYCRNLINVDMLTRDEKDWLNKSNEEIRSKTLEYFKDDELARNWLLRETEPF
ncbi:putative Xaa-Pro aminopeptidase 1 [Cladorrhinum sp. PSN332]|nr:putative Xaa-Pro aminopeptidase 1 [Cladorrhinum sp. PSN332]